MTILETERLILRPWRDEDLGPFAKLNADPRVMEYFPSLLTREESDQLANKIRTKIDERGWGAWAISLKNGSDFIGFIGLDNVLFDAPFTPAVEIGWRLAYDYWGKGYAIEGAAACLKYGFERLHLNVIVAFTAVQNMRSRRVMERIGMHHDPNDDFNHPELPNGNWLQRHVLYRIKASEWKKRK